MPPSPLTILAFSGGPDSTGLARLLREERPLLAYVDHRLRGPRAAREERATVKRIAASLGLELVRTRVRVQGPGEAGARAARYRALHALACKCGGAALATAHTMDDRAETILLQLLRGTGLRGLAALRRESVIDGVRRVRPALGWRRRQLADLAAPFGPVLDRSNRSTAFARSRLRGCGLPALGDRLGEDPVPLLCALGDLAEEVRAALESRAAALSGRATRGLLLAEAPAVFPYLVEALRPAGPPLTGRAYASLRHFLAAGRLDRPHVTPGGEAWRLGPQGRVRVLREGADRASSSPRRPLPSLRGSPS